MPSDKPLLTPRRWLTEAVGVALLLSAAAVLLDVSIDIYGIFRPAAGRHLAVYGDERIAKYLLSEKYVPANFNAILIGSSVSANWDTSGIASCRTYNESINGGNIVEAKAVADQALASPTIKTAILLVHPYLTSSHDFETVTLTPRENWAALGSRSLLEAYRLALRSRFHIDKPEFNEFGMDDFKTMPHWNSRLRALMKPGPEFPVDPIAMATYRDLVDQLHRSRVRIVFVVPPISQPLLDLKAEAFRSYDRAVLGERSPGDLVVDFTSDEYSGYRANPADYTDGVHLTLPAARRVVAEIDARMRAWGSSPTP